MTTSVDTTKPTLRWMLRDPARVLALSFGAGLAPKAPGTFGTLVAFPIHLWLAPLFTPSVWLVLLAIAFGIGAWVCGRAGRALGVVDHGALVWDETVAMLLVLFFTPAGIGWSLIAFGLFRAFDILKPPPIAYFDHKIKNGFGVMFDDLLAAGYSILVIAIIEKLHASW